MAVSTGWRNRIVRSGMAPVDQIQFSGKNWRIHPMPQQNALTGVLSEVGWVQNVLINERTGNLIDGHARVQVADRNGETEIPAVWVDLSEAEEALILATIDPLAAMAATDREQLAALLEEVTTGDEALQALLDNLAQDAAISPSAVMPPEDFAEYGDDIEQWARLGNAVPPVMMQYIAATIRDEILTRTLHEAAV